MYVISTLGQQQSIAKMKIKIKERKKAALTKEKLIKRKRKSTWLPMIAQRFVILKALRIKKKNQKNKRK